MLFTVRGFQQRSTVDSESEPKLFLVTWFVFTLILNAGCNAGFLLIPVPRVLLFGLPDFVFAAEVKLGF